MEIASSDRKYLRGLAHALSPLVRVGGAGVTAAVVAALDEALAAHELVKVKIADEREARKRVAVELAGATESVLAGQVGQMAILYRPAADPEDRRIALPSETEAS